MHLRHLLEMLRQCGMSFQVNAEWVGSQALQLMLGTAAEMYRQYCRMAVVELASRSHSNQIFLNVRCQIYCVYTPHRCCICDMHMSPFSLAAQILDPMAVWWAWPQPDLPPLPIEKHGGNKMAGLLCLTHNIVNCILLCNTVQRGS